MLIYIYSVILILCIEYIRYQMVRLRYSAVVKLVALFVFALIVVPSLLRIFSSPNGNSLDENQIPQELGVKINRGNRIDNNKNNNDDNNVDLPSRSGENPELAAVFKDGVLGNYEPVNLEPRNGPGEGGVGVKLTPEEKAKADRTVAEYGFNMVASDKISLDRRIKDTRPVQ
jgi:hypothetical protein